MKGELVIGERRETKKVAKRRRRSGKQSKILFREEASINKMMSFYIEYSMRSSLKGTEFRFPEFIL